MTKLYLPALALLLFTVGSHPLCADLATYTLNDLRLIDEIEVGRPADLERPFKEYPVGISRIETILGEPTRVLPNDRPGIKYFGYLIGKDKGLEAGGAYILEVIYPEDKARAAFLLNRGNETLRGFHTGNTVGDSLRPPFVTHHPESLEIPLSGQFERLRMLTHLQDRFSELAPQRGVEIPDAAAGRRSMSPQDGFWVYIAQFAPEQNPLSAGAAVSKIRLYQAPPFEEYALDIRYPPAELPRRHLFYREEAGDASVSGPTAEQGYDEADELFVAKAKLLRFLGMNTMGKDLLEFGANQGWDSSKFGGNQWVYQNADRDRWENIVATATEYGLSLLPYYEYAGSRGESGLGGERRAIPLSGENYTHLDWVEKSRADLTDPETFEDFRRMLEITIVDQKDRGRFLGAWLRPRPAQLPISFSDAALQRFAKETGHLGEISRERLADESELYLAYRTWWFDQRKRFLLRIRDYLRNSGIEDAVVYYTADASEAGNIQPGGERSGLVTENPDAWKDVSLDKAPVPLSRAIAERWSWGAQTQPQPTWSHWEWQHAVPEQDPANYQSVEGILPTYSFNRAYTVADPEALEAFTTESGLAIVRHYGMNENMLRTTDPETGEAVDPLGFFLADMERVGPYCMLGEALAMAHGNPTTIGYLTTNHFNRLSPAYARRFNAAFLALPALPSTPLPAASSHPEVAVRRIDAGKHGQWLAVVNPSYSSLDQVRIEVPAEAIVTDAATGEQLEVRDQAVTLHLDPCQLVALQIHP